MGGNSAAVWHSHVADSYSEWEWERAHRCSVTWESEHVFCMAKLQAWSSHARPWSQTSRECIARWFKMVSSYQFSLAIVQVETSMRESSRRELFVHGQLEALSASSILSILKIVIPNISRPFGCSTHASQSERTFYPLTLFICSINGYHGEYY